MEQRDMVQVFSFTGVAIFKSCIASEVNVANLSVHGVSDGVGKYLHVKCVEVKAKIASAERDVIWTEGTQSFASVLEMDCIEFVYLAASKANVDDNKGAAATV